MLVYTGYAVVKRWVKTSSITQALIVQIIGSAKTGFRVLVSTVIREGEACYTSIVVLLTTMESTF